MEEEQLSASEVDLLIGALGATPPPRDQQQEKLLPDAYYDLNDLMRHDALAPDDDEENRFAQASRSQQSRLSSHDDMRVCFLDANANEDMLARQEQQQQKQPPSQPRRLSSYMRDDIGMVLDALVGVNEDVPSFLEPSNQDDARSSSLILDDVVTNVSTENSSTSTGVGLSSPTINSSLELTTVSGYSSAPLISSEAAAAPDIHAFSTRMDTMSVTSSSTARDVHASIEHDKYFFDQLQDILSSPAYSEILMWFPDGRTIVIIDWKAFQDRILPFHFSYATLYASFDRSLRRHGFKRVYDTGIVSYMRNRFGFKDYRAYVHPEFKREEPGEYVNITAV